MNNIKNINNYAEDFYRFTKVFKSKKDAKDAIIALFELIDNDVKSGNNVRINNFGTFKLKTRQARKGRNPATGETIDIEEKQVIIFKPTKASK